MLNIYNFWYQCGWPQWIVAGVRGMNPGLQKQWMSKPVWAWCVFLFQEDKAIFSLRLMLLGCWFYLAWGLLFIIFILHCRAVSLYVTASRNYLLFSWRFWAFTGGQCFSLLLNLNVSPFSQLHSLETSKCNHFFKFMN